MITTKGDDQGGKKAIELKEDDHKEGDNQDQEKDDYHGQG
jgi:hypothetical protein